MKKRFTLWMLLVAFLCLPAAMMAQSVLTLSFVDHSGSTVREMTATLGEDFDEPRLVKDPANAQVRVMYHSTSPEIAEVDSLSGEVTLNSPGTVVITALSEQTEEYIAARAMYNLIVEAPQDTTPVVSPTCPEAYFFMDGARVDTIDLKVGGTVSLPQLITAEGEIVSGARTKMYDSSIAFLSEDNIIHGVAAGFTELAVTTVKTFNGEVLTCSYFLWIRVSGGEQPAVCPEAFFIQNGAIIDTLILKVGDVVNIPMLMGATGSILPLSAKTVEGSRAVVLTADDQISATGEGVSLFTGMYIHAVNGTTLQCEYSFLIIVEDAAPQKKDPELSWSEREVFAELDAPFTAPTLSNPHNVPINKIQSQNPGVAAISEDGKIVTINGVGETIIFAESYATDEYYATSVSYILHVSTLGLKVKGINVTSFNAHDVLGDSSHCVTFEAEGRILHLNNWNIDASNLTGLEAMIEDDGFNVPLTIKLHGENSIKNANICVSAPNVPVVVIGESQRDTWDLTATSVAIKVPYFKIHQCAVSAEAPLAALALGPELGVSINSHLLAKSQGLAIQTADLTLADGEEGVAILTPGVHFEKGKGFLTEDKQYAKEVEIGKVPVIPPSEEVTTIDFTKTDPEGNETVVFSTSENDNYNQETGQLEISTQLTDAQVAEALETLVPGSSAWVERLPGSLVFDIPAGEGKVRVNCMTLPGYKLQVKIEGKDAVSVQQVELGWAEATYNVPVPVHVVIYLHAPENASAPARIATRLNDTEAHAYIAAIEIAPKDAPQGIDLIDANTVENGSKLLIDGQLYIIREGRVFNASGAQVE